MPSRKTLIVEDEGLIALDLQRRLERAGYSVPATAESMEEAMAAAAEHRPDVVLMDIRIKGEHDGIATADNIRRKFDIPVIFVTAHADAETLERAKMTEPFGYIVKPFVNIDFRAQIETVLWKHAMERKLRISEAWLSTTFRNVADALIATDAQGNVVFMNAPAAKLTGWDWREARGKGLLEVFSVFEEATGLPVVHPLEGIYDGRELSTEARTYKLHNRTGAAPALIEAELSANRDEDGSLLGIIAVFRDVTERRRAEEQDRQLQKMNAVALLATGLGRELAESQQRMDGLLKELILDAQEPARRLLGTVYQCSTHQQSVIQKLTTLGKTDPGQPVLVDLNEVLKEMEKDFQKALGRGRSLSLELQPEIPPIQADAQELRDSLLRLVVEARNAMQDGGSVDISTAAVTSTNGKRRVRLSIRDTGKGVRANARDHMFDPYSPSRPGSRQAGFPLALVYQFVAVSGGTIDVESSTSGGKVVMEFPA